MSLTNSFGQLRIMCNYTNGNLEGGYKEYDENGKLSVICNYKNDKRVGTSRYRGRIRKN